MPSFTYQDSEARKPFEEPGEHTVTVEEHEFKFSSAGNEMLVLKIRTDGGALIFENLVFTEKAWWKIDQALKAFLPSRGKKPPTKGDNLDIDNDWVVENLLGARGRVILTKETGTNGKVRNNIESYVIPKPGEKTAPAVPFTPKPAAPAAAPAAAPPKPKAKFPPKPIDDNVPF